MNHVDLARAVADDLGPDVRSAVDASSIDDSVRSLSCPEVLAVAGFLLRCTQLALQVWQAKPDRNELTVKLAVSAELLRAYPQLDIEKRMECIARVIGKLDPGTGLPSSGMGSFYEIAEKKQWFRRFVESRQRTTGTTTQSYGKANTRDFIGGATILLPFADQNWWIVYQDIGWIPDAADGDDVVRVDVPKGFVTDLASVPRFLWAVINKVGLHGNAAIYHDWLYWQQACSRMVADHVFYRTMCDMGVDAVTRTSIWSAVRIFGVFAWKANANAKSAGEKRVLKQFPNTPTTRWAEWRQRPNVFM